MPDFLSSIDATIEMLLVDRRKLERKLGKPHECDCRFCRRKSEQGELEAEIKELDTEVERLERYRRDHAKETVNNRASL